MPDPRPAFWHPTHARVLCEAFRLFPSLAGHRRFHRGYAYLLDPEAQSGACHRSLSRPDGPWPFSGLRVADGA